MATKTAESDSKAHSPASSRLGLVLAICCAGQFMVVLDASVVNVALPSIDRSLHFGASNLQWVINAYTIAFAGFLLLGGRMADLYGRRRIFLAGITVFTISSLVGGLAFNASSLVVARAVQGLGAAIVAPATLTVLGTTFTDPAERGKAFGLWGAVSGGGGAIGVLVGGVITEWLSWRWILLVNVPVGILLFVGCAYAITELSSDENERRVDVLGALSVTLGLISLVYGVAEAQKYGWGSGRIITALAVGAVLLALFLVDQARLARQPLVPLSIFRKRTVTVANIVSFSASAALFSTFYFFTLYTQVVLGYSPLRTGLAYLPLSVGIFAGARGIAPLVSRIGPRWILVTGLALSVVGLAWLGNTSVDASFATDLLAPSLLLGFGQGMVNASVANVGTAGLPYQQIGLASGLLNTNRQLGGAFGLAVLVALSVSHTAHYGGGPDAAKEALASGYGLAFVVAAAFAAVGVLAALAAPAKTEPKN